MENATIVFMESHFTPFLIIAKHFAMQSVLNILAHKDRMAKDDIPEIERKVYSTVHEDGSWDIFFGIMILGMGLDTHFRSWITGMGLPGYISSFFFPGLAVLMMFLVKWHVTRKFGRFTYSPKMLGMRDRMFWLILVSVLATFGLLMLGMMAKQGQALSEYSGILSGLVAPLAISGLIFSVLAGMAYYMRFDRLYVIAAAFGTAMLTSELMRDCCGQDKDLVFLVLGVVILVNGLHLLLSLLGRLPRMGTA